MTANDNARKIGVCAALALGTALLYLPALHFDFVNYDDPIYVIDNLHIRTVSWQSLAWCFQPGYGDLWHPLTWMSHMLDFQLYGLHPGGHHATSVALHILNSMLLFLLLNRMTKALWPSAMVAALFAWHPLHVESVAWISERKDVLSALFWMLTIWAYVRFAEEQKLEIGTTRESCALGAGRKQKLFYGLALFFFALGLMSKPTLVTLPFVLLLLDWWPLGRIQIESHRSTAPSLSAEPSTLADPTAQQTAGKESAIRNPTIPRLLMEKIPFLVLSVIACGMTLRAAGHLVEPLGQFPLQGRLVNALLTYLRYVEKMVWPTDMVVVYPLEYHWSGTEVLMAGLFLIVVSVTAVRLWKARPFWLAGWLLYLGMLVPTIGLVQVGARPMADHNTYLPSIGIFMIICWEACDIARGWRQGRAVLGTVAGLALGGCVVVTHHQLPYWTNPFSLFTHNLEVTPDNYSAYADYAAFLRNAGLLEQAQKQAEKSIRLEPRYGWGHHVLGGILFLQGDYEKADSELRLALRLDPGRADVHLALGELALARNLADEAAAQFSDMVEFEKSNPQAHVGLGKARAKQGRLEDAREQFVEALRLAPRYPDAHHQLAVVLAQQHNTAGAVSEYRKALEIFPDRPESLNNLAWILATDPRPEIRNGAEALKFATAACRLTRDPNPLMLGTLAASCAEAGNFDQAVATAQQAHDLAAAQGKADIAARNLQLLEIYRSHRAFHEQ